MASATKYVVSVKMKTGQTAAIPMNSSTLRSDAKIPRQKPGRDCARQSAQSGTAIALTAECVNMSWNSKVLGAELLMKLLKRSGEASSIHDYVLASDISSMLRA